MASCNTLRQIFYAIFLTDVVGLDPRLASVAALIGVIWDAVNDPLVGTLSDNVRTRWGRRRPFLLLFAIPYALCFLLLWWAPPWQSQIALMIHVTLAFMISDTIQTLVIVPYLSLTPEIAPDYDERTALTGYRMFFNLLASLATAVAAPMIVDGCSGPASRPSRATWPPRRYSASPAALPFLVIFFGIRERTDERTPVAEPVSLRHTVRTLWANVPFRFATLLNMLNWITFDLVAPMLPFFLVYWVAGGDLVYQVDLLGVKLAIESAVLGPMFVVAVIALPLWTWAAQRLGKRAAYIGG
ncbi:MAG: MFS transporter [Kouleothrix sp.]|nr:MFS transporter [Kouleothrix sp.]